LLVNGDTLLKMSDGDVCSGDVRRWSWDFVWHSSAFNWHPITKQIMNTTQPEVATLPSGATQKPLSAKAPMKQLYTAKVGGFLPPRISKETQKVMKIVDGM